MDIEDRYDMDKPHSYLPKGYKPGKSKIKELKLILGIIIITMLSYIVLVITLS